MASQRLYDNVDLSLSNYDSFFIHYYGLKSKLVKEGSRILPKKLVKAIKNIIKNEYS